MMNDSLQSSFLMVDESPYPTPPGSRASADELRNLLTDFEERISIINEPSGAPEINTSSHRKLGALSFHGLIAICFGTALYGFLGVFTQLSMGSVTDGLIPYDVNAALLIAEIGKLLSTIILLLYAEGHINALRSLRAVPLKEWFLFSFPAVLYSITNNLGIVQLQYMDPGTNTVLQQSKIITTALLWWYWFKNPIDKQQWVSLCLLMCGSMVVAFPSTRDGANTMYVKWPMGPFLVLVMIVLSAMAGICTESVYKTYGRNRSIYIDNISMYIWGIASNAFQFYWIGNHEFGSPLITGFNGWTWMMVAVIVALGLTIGFIIKYFDNIVKLMMNGASIIVSGVLSYLVFGYTWTMTYTFGAIVVVCAVLLFNTKKKFIQ